MLIAISGIDGAGKTRLARRLVRGAAGLYRKQRVGRRFDLVLSSTGPLVADQLPSIAGQHLAEAYAEDFRAYVTRYPVDDSERSRLVFLDRWTACVEAFASVFANEPGRVNVRLAGVPTPDIEFLLDIDPTPALERICRRGAFDWDETPELLARLRAAYLKGAAERGSIVLDAAMPASEVEEAAWQHLNSALCPAVPYPNLHVEL